MTFCLDTNICIYFLTGKYPALLTNMLLHKPGDIKIPAIVKAELIYGAEKSLKRDENINKVESFLLPFEIIPFDNAASYYYGRIKIKLSQRGLSIGPNDLIIAATALSADAALVTNNTNEFSRVDGLRLENWI